MSFLVILPWSNNTVNVEPIYDLFQLKMPGSNITLFDNTNNLRRLLKHDFLSFNKLKTGSMTFFTAE